MPEPARILVSACLLGHTVRYDGGSKDLSGALMARWRDEGRIVPFCPEVAAGLPTPRAAAEIESGRTAADVWAGRGRIRDAAGADVTAAFLAGARLALDVAERTGCRFALLTDASPSCGSRVVHDGRFSGTLVPGIGVTADLLARAGLAVFAPDRLDDLAAAIDGVASSTARPQLPDGV